MVSDLMLVTAVLNSCINPLIYGSHYHTELRQQESRLRLGFTINTNILRLQSFKKELE